MDRFANRYRQILQDKANMGLGYGRPKKTPAKKRRGKNHAGVLAGVAVGGNAKNKKAAKQNPWIKYLKKMEKQTGVPYNQLLRDPNVSANYHRSRNY